MVSRLRARFYLAVVAHIQALTFHTCKHAADIISCVEFNSNGQYLATCDKGGRLVIGKDARTTQGDELLKKKRENQNARRANDDPIMARMNENSPKNSGREFVSNTADEYDPEMADTFA